MVPDSDELSSTSPRWPSGSHATTLVPHRKAATHDSEIRHLYEEMEAQIRNEKERLLLKVGPRSGL